MKLKKLITIGLTAVMAVSAMSTGALAIDNADEVVYTYADENNNDVNITQAELDAEHWDKDALGDMSPVLYENFPMSMTGFTNDFAELSLDIIYMKHIDEFDSVHLKIVDLLDDSIIYNNNIAQQSFYSPKLREDGQYEVTLTETADGETKEYTKVVFVNKTKAEMPAFVTNPEENENAKILIADIDRLKEGQTIDENGQITIDPTIARYDKVSANQFSDYCNALSDNKIYRVFASDENKQYGGFFSKSNGNEIYNLTIDAYSWEDINTPVPLTMPNITITDVKNDAKELEIADASFRLKDTSKMGGYSAYHIFLPQSLSGASANDAHFKINVTGNSKIAMKIWSSNDNNNASFLQTKTSINNTNTVSFDVYTEDYKTQGRWISFYVLVYFTTATDGYGMIDVEPISGYEDDVTGSISAAYNGESMYRELPNTEFTMTDSWDVDAFCIDYWGSEVMYKAEIKNRSLEDQTLLDSGIPADGSKEKLITTWSVSEHSNVLYWMANNVYTVPKNADLAVYCNPVTDNDRVITIQHNTMLGSTKSEKYQFSFKKLK